MKCPACIGDLFACRIDGVPQFKCHSCGGTWVAGAVVENLLLTSGGIIAKDIAARLASEGLSPAEKRCPCGTRMTSIVVAGTRADFCANCHSVFFRVDEVHLAFPLSESRAAEAWVLGELVAYVIAAIAAGIS